MVTRNVGRFFLKIKDIYISFRYPVSGKINSRISGQTIIRYNLKLKKEEDLAFEIDVYIFLLNRLLPYLVKSILNVGLRTLGKASKQVIAVLNIVVKAAIEIM